MAKFSELVQPGGDATGRTFVFENEGHTLGSALRYVISGYSDVAFCGYTIPHPAEAKMHLRIQTYETKPIEVLRRGLQDLEKLCEHTESTFVSAVEKFNS